MKVSDETLKMQPVRKIPVSHIKKMQKKGFRVKRVVYIFLAKKLLKY